MQGEREPPELRGVIPHAFEHIFNNIKTNSEELEYMVVVSYLEIYNEEVRDLLSTEKNPTRLELKENAETGIYVKGLLENVVSSVEEINQVMERGFKNRTVAATLMNQGSSRSHSIFTIKMEMCDKNEKLRAGKLNLVDLAGSERQSKTGASGARLKEGCKINLSLSALGNVIKALVDGGGKHIPYRDSKLTRLLQDSLGGNTKTVMVANISPADYNYDETLSTLRYANRAKNIKNKPIVNEDPKDAKLREFHEEIMKLREQLVSQQSNQVSKSIIEEKDQMNRELEDTAKQMEAHKREKEILAQKLKEMESKIIESTEKNEEASMKEKKEADVRRAQIKLQNEQKKEAQLKAAKAALELEKQTIEEEMKTAQETADATVKSYKKKAIKLKNKLREAKEEIEEYRREKDGLLDALRDSTMDLKLMEQLVELFLPPNEINRVWEKAEWIEEEEKWKLPKLKQSSSFSTLKLPNIDGGEDPDIEAKKQSRRKEKQRKKKEKEKEKMPLL